MKFLSIPEIQNALLNILICFDKICTDNNIEYWIDGGTLLGAVRHGDFIPWDDDIDVCVLHKDFDKLISLLRQEDRNDSNFILFSEHRPSSYPSEYFGDVRFIKNDFLPIQIDIIRVKNIEDDQEKLKRDLAISHIFKHHIRKEYNLDIIKGTSYEPYILDKKLNHRSVFYDFLVQDYLEELPPVSEQSLFNYSYGSAYSNREREYYNYDEIYPVSTIKFTDREFKCPNSPDKYLTKLYGKEYMSPPPESARKASYPKVFKHRLPKWFIAKLIYLIYWLKDVKYSLSRII